MDIRKTLSELNDIISIDDICAVLGVGRNTAYRLLRTGEIASRQIKRKYIIPRKSLELYIENICSNKIWY